MTKAASALKENPVVPILLSSVTGLTGLLAAFGGADAARINHHDMLTWAVMLVLAALLMGGAAALTELKLLVGVALALLVAGFVIAALAALDHQPGRPLLTASVRTKPRSELTVTVRRDGLGSGDEMEVFVEGRIYYTKKNNVSDTATRPPSVLYRASFGPNQDGKVDLSFSVPLPQKPRYTAVLVQTWVPFHFPTNKPEQTVGCGPQALNGPKYAAACVLATLPTARG